MSEKYTDSNGLTWEYNINDDNTTVDILSCSKQNGQISGQISIPEKIENNKYNVLRVSDYAFLGCSALTSVTIPAGVTNIGEYAFYNCSSLISISIPASVTEIGNGAFDGCSSLTSVTIPAGVTNIGEYAFYGCTSLTSVTIPSSVTSIDNDAFFNCSKLISVSIPSNVSSIGSYIFDSCSSLISAIIPSNVSNNLGDGIFSNCISLKTVKLNNNISAINSSLFSNCISLTSINFSYPNNIKSIMDSAFFECSSLTSIPTFTYVESIEDSSFENCSNLTSITIPASLSSIADGAFSGCKSLSTFYINNSYYSSSNGILYTKDGKILLAYPSAKGDINSLSATISSINYLAFSGCNELLSIDIPANINNIDNLAFYKCYSLKSISVDSNNDNYYSYDGILYNHDKNTLCICPNGKTSVENILSTINTINNYGFNNCISISSISIPSSVTSIGHDAFAGCSSLTSIIIPDGIININYRTFRGCKSLSSISIPDTVTSIGKEAFNNDSALTSMTIPVNVTELSNDAFSYCISLISVSIPSSVTHINKEVFRGCKSLSSISIPDTVTFIDNNAFYGCTSLTSVTIPNNVTYIGDGAFSNCFSLSSVSISIPDTVLSISNSAFYGCTSLTSVTIPGNLSSLYRMFQFPSYKPLYKQITNAVIQPGSKTIISDLFKNCNNLTFISIPESISSLNDDIFNDNYQLTSISIPLYIENFQNLNIESQLKKIQILGEGSVLDNFCKDFENLDTVILDERISALGNSAFQNTSVSSINLENIKIYSPSCLMKSNIFKSLSSDCTCISDYAFYDTALSSLSASSLQKIGDHAFSDEFRELNLLNNSIIPEIPESKFNSSNISVIVPLSSIYFRYISSDNWKDISSKIYYQPKTWNNYRVYLDPIKTKAVLSVIDLTKIPEIFEVPSSVIDNISSEIGDYGLSGCTSIKDLSCHVNFGKAAFKDCINLSSISYILSSIPASAFSGIGIKDLSISGIFEIGDYGFSNCHNLSLAVIPEISVFHDSAFLNCINLSTIQLSDRTNDEIPQLCSVTAFQGLPENYVIYVNPKMYIKIFE